MLNQNVQDALNDQIQAELDSAYIYLGMSAYIQSQNYPGFAAWMQAQAQEESQHAMKIYGYIVERGGRVQLKALGEPPAEYQSPLDVFQKAYEHEQYITGRINSLFSLARSNNDPATESLMLWFVNEQVEEEKTMREIVAKLRMIGDDAPSLLDLDRELGSRQPDAGEGGEGGEA